MRAVDIAKAFVGQHEGKNNTFDSTTPLGKAVLSVGHVNGQPWCSRFVLYCVKQSDDDSPKLDTLVTPSAVTSFNNVKAAFPKSFTKEPIKGKKYIVAWQSYKDGKANWTGHIGLVIPESIKDKSFKSIEGNAAEVGVTREGVQVAEVAHKFDSFAYEVQTGLRLLGFIEI